MSILNSFNDWGFKNFELNDDLFRLNLIILLKNIFLNFFLSKIKNFDYIYNCKTMLTSSIQYYIISLFFCISHLDLLNDTFLNLLEKCYEISICCFLIDYIIDEKTDNKLIINNLLKNIDNLKNNKDLNFSNCDILTKDLLLFLQKIINKEPSILPLLIKGLKLEIKSKNQTFMVNLNEISVIELNKSHQMTEIIMFYLNGNNNIKVPKNLSFLLQLIDDLFDIKKDELSGINTYVSLNLKNNNYLLVFNMFFEKINNLDNRYILFKLLAIFSIQYNLKHFGEYDILFNDFYIKNNIKNIKTLFYEFLFIF